MKAENKGLWLGLLGVLIFSATLPFTRMAVGAADAPQLSPYVVALGRAVVAAVFAAAWLFASKAPKPRREQLPWFALTSLGVVFGFPLLTTWAMRHVPSAHGAVITGLLPLITAMCGALIQGDRPSRGFWLCAVLGSVVVVGFALRAGGGALQAADWALFAAMILAPIGYSTGAKLSAQMGGVNAICWVLVLSLPLTLPLTGLALYLMPQALNTINASSWLGFAYVSLFSQLIGFFAWYRGLAAGGVARVSQTQLLQPFLTLLIGAALINERLEATTLIFALVVVALVFIGRRMPIKKHHD